MINIDTQSALEEIISKFPWHDSFVREAHVLSPSYVKNDGSSVIAPNSLWTVRLLVCTCDRSYPAIEFVFEDAEQITLSGSVDLNPRGRVGVDDIEIFLSTNDPAPIRARKLQYQLLDIRAWGTNTRYSVDNLFDEFGFLA